MNDSGSNDKQQTSLKVTYEAQYGVSHLKKRCGDDSTAVAKCRKLSRLDPCYVTNIMNTSNYLYRNLVSSTNHVTQNELITSVPSGCHANPTLTHSTSSVPTTGTGSLYGMYGMVKEGISDLRVIRTVKNSHTKS